MGKLIHIWLTDQIGKTWKIKYFTLCQFSLRLAQLGECKTNEQEVTGPNHGQTNTNGLKITKKKELYF